MYASITEVQILCTNHRGETSLRRVIPLSIHFAETEWHPGKQWVMDAIDCDKQAKRTFALKDILRWVPANAVTPSDGPTVEEAEFGMRLPKEDRDRTPRGAEIALMAAGL